MTSAALLARAETGARLSDGDARTALNVLEIAASDPGARVTEAAVRDAVQKKTLLYDKSGEQHYNLISALHKSLRDSDPDGALYWLGRMLEAGEDPLYVARRLVRFASEDVGNADPAALRLTLDAKEAYHFLGTPEGELALAQATECPTVVVFDLDPGAPADLVSCCEVALILHDLFARLHLQSFAKTSGSKGLQLYVPLNSGATYGETKPFSRSVAEALAIRRPELVVSNMKKSLRGGKVLLDWSQNDPHKTTVCVYSLRARERPTVSTPVEWDEVAAAAMGVNTVAVKLLAFSIGAAFSAAYCARRSCGNASSRPGSA